MGNASMINMEDLLLQIEEFGFVESAERQIIMSFPDSHSQMSLMYNIVKSKGPTTLGDLLASLKSDGHYCAAVSTLEDLDLKSNYIDFQVQDRHVNCITDLLEGIPITRLQWNGILRRLITCSASRLELDNLLLNQPLRETMLATLKNWIAESGDEAKFSIFVEIVVDRNKHAADELIKQRDSIFNAK